MMQQRANGCDALRARVAAAFTAPADPTSPPSPGLLLARGLASHGKADEADAQTPAVQLMATVAAQRAGELYAAAYHRWQAALGRWPSVASKELEVAAGLAVGLGNESVLEVGLTLSNPYGVPVIPGSALKGLARHYAGQVVAAGGSEEARRLGAGGDHAKVLFGDTEQAAYCTYFDAWYVPGSAPEDRPLVRDVVTVHHKHYYTGGPERRPPWDFDDPVPIPFLHARGRYLAAVAGPDAAWSTFALALLAAALADYGVGGKTAAGYGRLRAVAGPQEAQETPAAASAAGATRIEHTLVMRLRRLQPGRIRSEIDDIVNKWRGIESPEDRAAVGRALLAAAERTKDRRWLAGRAAVWLAEVAAYVDAHPCDERGG